ncbi:response regulator [Dinoroseobacter sp. S375]|uniref:response regulator n=1 Tax=Dinoroseobacter sp. S375 TaxID=3415136 RepID=UPI003C7B3DC6
MQIAEIEHKLAAERRARLTAERLLAQKQEELFAANEKLSKHAFTLSDKIVEQRHHAEELKDENFQVRSDLRRAEQRLWTSFETIEDGFAVFDSSRRLVLANPAYMSIFDGIEAVAPGAEYTELLKLCVEEGIIDTEGLSRADWCAMMQERWNGTQIEPAVVRLWNGYSIKLVERRGEDGDIVSLCLNITDTIRREKDLTIARTRAEAANRAKSAFLANMTHELRTPMNGVVGMAELLCDSPLDEEQLLYVETIRKSGEALLVIINDVLDYSKMEAEKLQLHPGPIDLEHLMHDVVMLAKPTAQEKNVDLMLDYDIFLPSKFIGDQGRMRQVMTNLLGNAVKFTLEGHVLLRVIGMPPEDGAQEIIISIEDTGIGIAPEMIDHIFGEFNQAEDERNRAFEGTGLGLAITKQLIELMGGEIWVDSVLGEGSCFSFRITLPLNEEDGEPPLAITSDLRRVLIVDETEINRSILERQLAPLGVSVSVANSVEDALEYLDGHQDIDAVLTDLVLPGLSGSDLARKLRDRPDGPPVILLSSAMMGQLNSDDRDMFQATLSKPVMRADLYAALNALTKPAVAAPAAMPSEAAGQALPPVETPPAPEQAAPTAIAEVPVAAPEPAAQTAPPEVAARMPDPEPEPEPAAKVVEPGPFMSARRRAQQADAAATPAPVQPAPAPAAAAAPAPQAAPDPAGPKSNVVTLAPAAEPVAEPAPPAAPVAPEPPAAESTSTRKISILAAEDNKTNQLVFRKMVKTLNIELRFANNGEEAVAAYKDARPDMIFMDISMPKMDGMEATRTIRALERETGAPRVPITALTAHAMDGDADRILAAGLDHYLTKPLKKAEIMGRIEELVPEGCQPLHLEG